MADAKNQPEVREAAVRHTYPEKGYTIFSFHCPHCGRSDTCKVDDGKQLGDVKCSWCAGSIAVKV